jgi:peroxiredoxin
MIRLIALISLLIHAPAVATPAEADRIRKTYELAMEEWTLEMRRASTPEARAKAWSARPDAAPYAHRIWALIGNSLADEWTLDPAAWFLRLTPGLLVTDETGSPRPIFTKQTDTIRNAIETHHLQSPKLTAVCAALASSSDPRSLALLEKIEGTHPDKKIQGVAALGAAMQLKHLGDDGEIMRRRLTFIRKSIIQAADVEIEGTAIAKLAEDELYIIRYLTKGRIAPDLVGVDSANRAISLSAHKGKVIVLLFWHSNIQDAARVVEITSRLEQKFKGRPLVVLGVNSDPLKELRSLQADGIITWPNFSDPENKLAQEYRIGSWPLVYVLDGERKIHYAGAPGSFAELTAEALVSEIR